MPGFTTRLGLYKPGGGSSGSYGADEQVDIDKINGNMDVLDGVIGFPEYTSTTRPSVPFGGQTIYESDTKRYMRYSQSGAIWSELASPGQGLTALKPASVINGTVFGVGRVDFTAQSTVSLNGIFTSAYDNYRIVVVIRARTGGSGGVLRARLRLAGTDAAGGGDYSGSIIQWDTSASGGQTGAVSYVQLDNVTSLGGALMTVDVSDPALAQATGFISTWSKRKDSANTSTGVNSAAHQLATAYDGLTIFPDVGTITGTIHVYGYSN